MADKTMKFDITAKDNASAKFAQVGVALDRLAQKLDDLGHKKAEPKVTLDSVNATTRIQQFAAALNELNNKRVRVDVDMGTAKADVGELRRELSLLRSNVKVKVDLTAPPAAQVARVQQLREALRELDGINANATVAVVGNLPDPAELRRAARALKDLQDVHDIAIHISITGAVTALAQVVALRRELRALPGDTTVKVKAEADSSKILSAARSLLSLKGAAALVGPTLLGSTVPAVATLVGSLTSLIGLAPVAVAGLAAMGVTALALKVGLSGVGDALKESDPKKFAESLKGLAPAAREFVTAYRQVKPALDGVKLDTQQKLFDGLGKSVKQLSTAYLPSMRSNLGGVATELNGVAKNVVAFARSSQTMQDVNTIFDNTRVALHNAAPAANNILGTFRDIAVVGSDFLPGLATGWTNATQRFQTFINEARQSGQLKVWIQGGIDTLKTLGSITGNVGSALGSVFTAAKASGADFLSTLDRVTEKVADLLASSTGQSSLTAFFRESREAVDALMPGVESLAGGVLDLVRNLSNSGGVRDFAATLSELAETAAPLGATIGQIAGEGLSALAGGASIANAALSPLVGLVGNVGSGLSGLIGPALAAVVAFKALGSAAVVGVFTNSAAALTRMSQSLAFASYGSGALAGAAGAASTATSKLSTAVSKAGSALPLVGVALIAAGALMDEFGDKSEENAGKVISGTQSMSQAIAANQAQLEHGTLFWFSAQQKQDAYAKSAQDVTDEVRKQYDALSPMAKLQADVSMSQADLNDAVAQFGANSPQAVAAGQRLAAATQSLKTAHDGAAQAAMTQEEKEQALANTMSSQIDTALAYAQAVQRTADAHKAADEALKSGGAKSEEYKGAVLSLAAAMSSQADAARKQAEALGGTEAGVQAYNTEILRSADLSTKAGRDAFAQLADGLDDAGLSAITAAAKLSGLRTEVVTLPDGRKVTVVVEADRGKLDSVKQGVEDLASKKYIGTIQILAETTNARGDITQTVQLADGSRGTIKVDADGGPAILTVGATKYTIDATTGTIKVLGDVAPGETSLAGLKVHVDATTGAITIDGNPAPANAKTAGAKATMDSSIGTITIDGNPTQANGKTTTAIQFADGSRGTITIDGNQTPANGKVNATVTYANGRTGTIKVDAATAAANGSISALVTRWNGYTININTVVSSRVGGLAGGGVIGYSGGGVVGPRPVRAARGLVLSGYQPGRDTVPAMLSKGEAVLVPEAVRALGARRILAMNAEVSGGRPGTVTGSVAGMMDGRIGSGRVAPPAAHQSRALTARIGGVAAASSRAATSSTIRAQLDDARLAQKLDRVRETIGAAAREGSPDVVAAIDTLARALLASSRTSVAVTAQARRTDSELAGLR